VFRRLLPLLLAALALPAPAREFPLGSLVIDHPWSRATAPGMPMGVAYLSIRNRGKDSDTLIGANSPAASRVEMHETSIVDGMARMRPLSEIAIPPGATVRIQPGGIHLMLVDLKLALERGATVPLVLEFRHAGKITVQLEIEARDLP
jgi:copper(I)-binding protein